MNIEIKESMVQYFIQTRVGGGAEIQRKHIYYVDKIAMKRSRVTSQLTKCV
jgi:hypothetical protein